MSMKDRGVRSELAKTEKSSYNWDILAPQNISETKVVPELIVPRWPEEMRARQLLSGTFSMIAEWSGKESERLAVVDKLSPHAALDAMIISSGTFMKRSIKDLSREELNKLLFMCHGFVQFISESTTMENYGKYPYCLIVLNYNPECKDREGLQAHPRFHVHLNPLNKYTVDQLADKVVPLGEVKSIWEKRRIVDPIAFLAIDIMSDALAGIGEGVVEMLRWKGEYLIANGKPIGLHMRLGNGWNTMVEERFADVLETIHLRLMDAYTQIRKAFCGNESKLLVWERPILLKPEEVFARLSQISWLSEKSRNGLVTLSRLLRPLSKELIAFLRERSTLQEVMTIEGLPYTIGIYNDVENKVIKNSSSVYLLIQAKLFSPDGGAGVIGLGGISAIRLRRENGRSLSFDEMNKRVQFLREYSDYIGLNAFSQRKLKV